MDRNGQFVVIALICILAISIASATLADPQPASGPGKGGAGFGPSETGNASQLSSGSTDENVTRPVFDDLFGLKQMGPPCVSVLRSQMFALALIGACLSLGSVVYYRRGPVSAVAVVGSVLLIAATVLLSLTSGCYMSTQSSPESEPLPEFTFANQSTEPAAGGSTTAETVISFPAVLAVVGVLIAAFVVVVYYASGSDTDDSAAPTQSTAPQDRVSLADIGDAASEAADRIEGAERVDNEVYRAWREMTRYVELSNPEASTPAEFATAAAEAGMATDHVDELTELFRSVRYGESAPTAAREERAVAVLRSIETHYADESEE